MNERSCECPKTDYYVHIVRLQMVKEKTFKQTSDRQNKRPSEENYDDMKMGVGKKSS